MERWAFPPELVEAVTYHHQPGDATTHKRLAATVYVANMLAYFLGYGYGYQAFALSSRAEALDILELGTDDLPNYMIKTQESYLKVKKLFEDHG
jgi:HD-like signal output (HDOD) protein